MTDFNDISGHESLVTTIMSYATPETIGKASGLLGESPQTTKTAMAAAAPALVGAVAHLGSIGNGAQRITELIQRFGLSQVDPSQLMSQGLAGAVPRVGDAGPESPSSGILSAVLGERSTAAAQAIARYSGAKPESVAKIMAWLAPIVLGLVAQKAQGRDASWLAGYLGSQEKQVINAIPAGLRTLIAPSPAARAGGAASVTARGASDTQLPRWLPIAAVAALILGGLWFLGKRNVKPKEVVTETVPTLVAPATESLSVANRELRDFLADVRPEDLPKTITFRELNFEFGTADLDAASVQIVDDLAQSLLRHPDVSLRLEGHTDDVGDATVNKLLSLKRATAVRDRLAAKGVDVTAITVEGLGAEKPVLPNTTEEGRSQNRRVEVVVIGIKGEGGVAH